MSKHTPILPLTVAGDSPDTPPMIWDASGDAIVSQMPDGRPYFESDVAEFIVRACNSYDAMVEALEQEICSVPCHRRCCGHLRKALALAKGGKR